MQRRTFLKAATAAAVCAAPAAEAVTRVTAVPRGFDVLIENGLVTDGSGKRPFMGSIGITGDTITYKGKPLLADAAERINANGLHIAPGFIDIHSHTDSDLLLNPKAESKIRQGVTTEVTGQDGFSWGPFGGAESDIANADFKTIYGVDVPWKSFGEFLEYMAAQKFSVNLASMLGLGTIRQYVVGMDNRPPTADEMRRMEAEVRAAFAHGAIGASTGLEYTPGSFAGTDELARLCRVIPRKQRLYATHMRNEDNTVLEAFREAITIARNSGAALQVSHLKVSGKSNWQKVDELLTLFNQAAASGVDIHADRYTYVAYHTNLSNLFPLWARDGGTDKFLGRLQDAAQLKEMQAFAEKKVSNLDGGWDGVLVSSTAEGEAKQYQGKTILGISRLRGTEPFRVAVDLLLITKNSVMMMGFGMEEHSTEAILAHPRVMISSDAGSHAPYPPMNRDIAHPRAYGTFPRAIARYVRERKICSVEAMVRKMTLLPARKLGLHNRGKLATGNKADIVLFNFATIKDNATFTDPHRYPDGIPYVLVNGKTVIANGEHTGAMPGTVLRG